MSWVAALLCVHKGIRQSIVPLHTVTLPIVSPAASAPSINPVMTDTIAAPITAQNCVSPSGASIVLRSILRLRDLRSNTLKSMR